MPDSATIVTLVISGVALLVSGFAWYEARRSANAAQISAREAERANDIAYANILQTWGEKVIAEIDKQRNLGNEANVNVLNFMFGKVQLDTLRKFANTDEESRKMFTEFFTGIAERTPDDKEAIKELIAYVLQEK